MWGVKGVTAVQEAEARAELQAVLSSTAFVRSPRLARLIEYLCTQYFDGVADQIKEYTIAVEVLGRPDSFEPSEDAIARVEVHRLRKKLRDHYASEGAARKFRIVIPTGSYVPTFLPSESVLPGGDDDGVLSGVLSRDEPGLPDFESLPVTTVAPRSRILALTLLVVVLFAGAAFWLWPRPASSVRASGPAVLPAAVTVPNIAIVPGKEVRILCGQRKPHTDRLGKVWAADAYFEGGNYNERQRIYLARTFDATLFQNARAGDFSYHIPLQPGVYELHLYFAETIYGPGTTTGGGENSRTANVLANGRRILTELDIVSDASGTRTADVRVFKNISPGADGLLNLVFQSLRGQAMVSAIELVPAAPNRLNPVRIYVQDNSYNDSHGRLWMPDNYSSGGQIAIHTAAVQGDPDPDLYASERYGNFTYAIPADEGVYQVSLYFAETYWGPENAGGGGVGSRLFDVFCNGVALLRNFDIYKEAGANKALTKTFHGLKPNAQGKLFLSFVPVRNYAAVYAIEVTEE